MKVAINGFGRIGKAVFKICLMRGINVVAINDLHGAEDAAYMLKYDSVYGRFSGTIKTTKDSLIVNGKKIKVISEQDPLNLPWEELGIDVVIEATGVFRERKEAMKHIASGAKKVIVTAPSDDADLTLVPGVNDSSLNKKMQVISVASCTTNALAPVLKVLDEKFGIEEALMTTIHSYTSSQSLVDSSNKKRRRGRAAAINIIPTTTGATDAVCLAYPKLRGKINGFSLRVPIANGSLVDLTAELKKGFTIESLNKTLENSSKGKLKGILGYTEDEIVSSDVIGTSESGIVDGLSTQKEGNLAKLLVWYDNEYGYSNRVVDVLKELRKFIK